MLYIALRILLTAERRAATVLVSVVCGLGICEVWIGLSQAYGLTGSNHGLFCITGTFFNPGPYAGYVTVAGICGMGALIRGQQLARRVFRSWCTFRRQRPGVLIWGIVPWLSGWGAAVGTAIILPSTWSRAAWVAAAAACAAATVRQSDLVDRIRRAYGAKPLRVCLFSAVILLLVAGLGAGTYCIKRPSADGRLLLWKIDARILLRHPLCGVGLGNFAGAFGDEQAAYFAERERPQEEIRVAGCPEWGFNEFLQFGAETGIAGLVLFLLTIGTALVSLLRRADPLGYGLLAAMVFACFSYPWSVLPLRLLFTILLAATRAREVGPLRKGTAAVLLAGSLTAWPALYARNEQRVNARRQWNDMHIWITSGRYDLAADEGKHVLDVLRGDFRFLYDYGYSLHKTGEYTRSNQALQLGMQISSDPMFRIIAGKNCEALGDRAAAEAYYRHAADMLPDRIYPLYLLARLHAAAGRTEKARAAARKAVAHRPKIESVQTREMQQELRALLQTIATPQNVK